jgi:hypothetical protein
MLMLYGKVPAVIRREASKQFDVPVKRSQTSVGTAIVAKLLFLQFPVGVWL